MDVKIDLVMELSEELADALELDEETSLCAWFDGSEIHIRIEDESGNFGDAFADGYEEGAAEGYGEGHAAGYNEGLTEGYRRGFRECLMKYLPKNVSRDEEWRN